MYFQTRFFYFVVLFLIYPKNVYKKFTKRISFAISASPTSHRLWHFFFIFFFLFGSPMPKVPPIHTDVLCVERQVFGLNYVWDLPYVIFFFAAFYRFKSGKAFSHAYNAIMINIFFFFILCFCLGGPSAQFSLSAYIHSLVILFDRLHRTYDASGESLSPQRALRDLCEKPSTERW